MTTKNALTRRVKPKRCRRQPAAASGGERCDLQPLIDAVRDSLYRLEDTYHERGKATDCTDDVLDLHMVVGDIEDAIDKAGQ